MDQFDWQAWLVGCGHGGYGGWVVEMVWEAVGMVGEQG